MPLATYVMPYLAELADVDAPPQTNEAGGPQLRYVDAQGRERGGRADASDKPPPAGVPTVLVVVDADEATHAAMRADGRYCWVEDLAEE